LRWMVVLHGENSNTARRSRAQRTTIRVKGYLRGVEPPDCRNGIGVKLSPNWRHRQGPQLSGETHRTTGKSQTAASSFPLGPQIVLIESLLDYLR
jgi:hypothetical protein